jgi:hypothetical protein
MLPYRVADAVFYDALPKTRGYRRGMARSLTLVLDGKEIPAGLGTNVDKKALYGYTKRAIEKDGKTLTRGHLNPAGKLLRSGQLTLAKVDPEGTPVEDTITEIDGKTADLLPSSFDAPTPLQSVPLKTLIGFSVRDVYPLKDAVLPEGLYQTSFSYRKTYRPLDALVLAKRDGGVFLLTGSFKSATFVGLAVVYDFFDAAPREEAEEEEEMSFAMM